MTSICLFTFRKHVTIWDSLTNHQQHLNVFVQFCHIPAVLHFFYLHHTSKFWTSSSFGEALPSINNTLSKLIFLRSFAAALAIFHQLHLPSAALAIFFFHVTHHNFGQFCQTSTPFQFFFVYVRC